MRRDEETPVTETQVTLVAVVTFLLGVGGMAAYGPAYDELGVGRLGWFMRALVGLVAAFTVLGIFWTVNYPRGFHGSSHDRGLMLSEGLNSLVERSGVLLALLVLLHLAIVHRASQPER
jgi:hypothetical protein